MDGPRWSGRPCLGLLLLGLCGADAAAQAGSSRVVLASMDVSLTHRVVATDGSPLPAEATHTALTLQKVRDASGKTMIVMTYRRTPAGARTRATETPLEGARIEYDPESGATTVFDQEGRRANPRLSSPSHTLARLGPLDGWLGAMAIARNDAASRQQALERSHGRPDGRVGRLTRYVHTDGDLVEQVLADPEWALPVEITRRRNGRVEAHTTIEYGTTATGLRIRRRIRTEQLLDGGARRSLLAIDFTNVVSEGGEP